MIEVSETMPWSITKINLELPHTPRQVCLPPQRPATTREGGGTATRPQFFFQEFVVQNDAESVPDNL